MASNGIMLYFACLSCDGNITLSFYSCPPPFRLKCMKLGHDMIEQCSRVVLIVLMVSVCSALKRPEDETCERTLLVMAEAAGEFLITDSRSRAEGCSGG